jgi:integrase
MTFDEYDKFMTTIENHKDKNGNVDELERLQSMLMFSIYYCFGTRLAECLQLKFSDYKESERTLYITKSWDYVTNVVKGPKTKNSIRDFYVTDEIQKNIKNLADYYKKIKIYSEDLQMFSSFTTAKHRPGQNTLSPTTVRRKRDMYLTEAGLSHMRIHDFRHSSASHLLSCGVSMEQIAKHLGDTESIADAVYSHMNRDAKKDIANQFDRKNTK